MNNYFSSDTKLIKDSEEQTLLLRYLSMFGVIVYSLAIVVDYWILDSSFFQALIFRSISIVASGFLIIATYHNSFIKNHDRIVLPMLAVTYASLEAVIFLSQSSALAFSLNFIGLFLLINSTFYWLSTSGRANITLALVATVVYVFIEITSQAYSEERIPAVIVNTLFLLVTITMGVIGQRIRYKYLTQNLLLQEKLSRSLNDKTKEADHDLLTGLPNRRYFLKKLEYSLAEVKENNQILVVFFLDLNGFKAINDRHGHKVGDEILIVTAKRLESVIREGECVSRLGGDEYLVSLILEEQDYESLDKFKQNFIDVICKPIKIGAQTLTVGTSVGCASYPHQGDNISKLIELADKEMYKHKESKHKPDFNVEEFELDIVDLRSDGRLKAS